MAAGPGLKIFDAEVYRRLVNHMPVGATIARWEDPPDPGSFRFMWVNVEAKTVIGAGPGGVPCQEILGRTFREVFPDEMAGDLPGLYARAMNTGQTQELGLVEVKSEGVPSAVFQAQAIRVNAQLVSVLHTNITDRVKAKGRQDVLLRDLTHVNQDLDRFAYVASHDLKAPLRDISSLSQWVVEDLGDKIPENSRRNLELMRGRVERMERLLDDLLEYSRSGKKFAPNQEIHIDELLTNVLSLAGTRDGFEVSYPKRTRIIFDTQRPPLELVLRNLISNAMKHHDKRTGQVELQVQATVNGQVEFTVTDDGPGIPEEFHRRVFEMFQTLKPRDEVEGTGMGLALVAKLVDAHGAKIELESPGQERGTTFRLTWPGSWRADELPTMEEH